MIPDDLDVLLQVYSNQDVTKLTQSQILKTNTQIKLDLGNYIKAHENLDKKDASKITEFLRTRITTIAQAGVMDKSLMKLEEKGILQLIKDLFKISPKPVLNKKEAKAAQHFVQQNIIGQNYFKTAKMKIEEKDGVEAFNFMSKAAANKNPEAQNAMGMYYFDKLLRMEARGNVKDEDVAQWVDDMQEWRSFASGFLNDAAAQNYPQAHVNLGLLHLSGKGSPIDIEEARKHFAKGAELGDMTGKYWLARTHLIEVGDVKEGDINSDPTEGLKLLNEYKKSKQYKTESSEVKQMVAALEKELKEASKKD